jgi:frataxin-like iron-binding protein CyaY
MDPSVKQVYEIDKSTLDNLFSKIDETLNEIKKNSNSKTEVTQQSGVARITIKEFGKLIRKGRTTVNKMKNGNHPSGFHLNAFRKPGTRNVYTTLDEVDRYWEGFGENKCD